MVVNRFVQKVLVGKRITLPEAWCKKWELHAGDIVVVEYDGQYLRIAAAEVREKHKK